MNIDEIKLLYEYSYWANHKILDTCTKISQEQFISPGDHYTGYGSLRATVVHILDAEWGWRQLLQGIYNAPDIMETDFPTLETVTERCKMDEQEMRAYIWSLTDENLNGIVRYPLESGTIRERPLWHCLVHVVNHGTQHRSEAAAMLTKFGFSPGGFDFTLFLNEYYHLPN